MLIGLALALLVQAGWLLLLQLHRSGPDPQQRPYRLALRLIAEPVAKVSQRPAPAARSDRFAAARPTPTPTTLVTPDEETSAAPAPLRSSQMPAAALPAPLNLALPPSRPASGPRAESMLSQMLNDSRSRSAKRTLEWAIADVAGSLPVTSAAATDGTNSKLIRQGSKCIRVAESRIKTLNPMDDGARGAPDVSGSCTNN